MQFWLQGFEERLELSNFATLRSIVVHLELLTCSEASFKGVTCAPLCAAGVYNAHADAHTPGEGVQNRQVLADVFLGKPESLQPAAHCVSSQGLRSSDITALYHDCIPDLGSATCLVLTELVMK